MAFQTGTYTTMPQLMNILNTFMTGNGWTRLRGETDMAVNSPKAARYWRLNVRESIGTSTQFRAIREINFHAINDDVISRAGVTATASSFLSGNVPANCLVSDTTFVRSAQVNNDRWWLAFDFGSAVTIGKIVIICELFSEAPEKFEIQWSNDNYTWTTMQQVNDPVLFTANFGTATIVWDTGSGFTSSYHAGASLPRRSGLNYFMGNVQGAIIEIGSSNLWAWQGPGYDADRRVFIYGYTFHDSIADVDSFGFSAATGIITDLPQYIGVQAGTDDRFVHLIAAASGTKTYWAFLNSTRLIVIIKNGLDDYTSMYAGFLKAFATPNNYAFPLFVSGTANAPVSLGSNDSRWRAFWDPGDSPSARFRDVTGVWRTVRNHTFTSGDINAPLGNPIRWTWPWHSGCTNREAFPFSVVGDWANFDFHFLDRIEATTQNEVPLFASMVCDINYGNIGAMDGVYCVPRGGVISAEQVISVGGFDYQVFQNRDRTNGDQYAAILRGVTP